MSRHSLDTRETDLRLVVGELVRSKLGSSCSFDAEGVGISKWQMIFTRSSGGRRPIGQFVDDCVTAPLLSLDVAVGIVPGTN